MNYNWVKTTLEIYRAIYELYKDDLRCFESYTKMDSYEEKLEAQITGWGFADANHPIIRSELSCGEWTYYLLRTVYEEDK